MREQQREIAELAYEYWLARFGVQYGPPEEDLFKAQREVMARISRLRITTAGLFLV